MLGSNSKKICCTMLVGLLFLVDICRFVNLGSNAAVDSRIEVSKKRQRDIVKRKDSLKKELNQVESTIKYRKNRNEELNAEINSVKKDIDVSNEVITDLNKKIDEQKKKLEEKQSQIVEDIDKIKKRLRAIYMEDGVESIDVILGAKSFLDFFDRVEMAQCMLEKDEKVISRLKEDKEVMEEQTRAIEESRNSMTMEVLKREEKKTRLEKLMEENEKLIQESKDQALKIKDKIDQNDKEYNRINREIEEYYRRQQELLKKQRQQNNGKVHNIAKGTGRYMWPVPGHHYISSNYTDTVNRGGKIHGAIDIAGRGIYGSSVVAADTGVVIKVNTSPWGGGYGNFIVIDHGNGRSTLYGHLSLKCVSVGQTVTKGQKIGNVGNTGFSTGPHLHFETRLNGRKYDPLTEVC